MKKLFLMLLAASFAATSFADSSLFAKKIISKDEKDNIAQVLWALGAVGAASVTGVLWYVPKRYDSTTYRAIAALVASGCAYKWFKKLQERTKAHNYESTLEFLQDDTLVKIQSVWEHVRLNIGG